jgi:hypothetical protein
VRFGADWPQKARREEQMVERGRRVLEIFFHNAFWLRLFRAGNIPYVPFPANLCFSYLSDKPKQKTKYY